MDVNQIQNVLPTSILLGRSSRWRGEKVTVSQRERLLAEDLAAGLRLRAHADGALALNHSHCSLGGLVLPRGMAQHPSGALYLLDPTGTWRKDQQGLPEPEDAPRVRRYNSAERRFEPLPYIGGYGCEARQFREPANLAISESHLYVADWGNHCLKTFHLNSLTLVRAFFGPDRVVPYLPGVSDREIEWCPVDVAVGSRGVFVLDGKHNRVFEHTPGSPRLSLVINAQSVRQISQSDERGFQKDDKWIRMAVDDVGRVYLLREGKTPRVDVFTSEITEYEIPSDSRERPNFIRSYGGLPYRFEQTISDAGSVRSRFTPPQIVLDHAHRFCLEGARGALCAHRTRRPVPPIEAPLAFCRNGASPPASNARVFDGYGRELELSFDELSAGWSQPLYAREGAWFSESLDSRRYRCQWHRIELDLADLPAGTWVEVATTTSDQPHRKGSLVPDHLWDKVPRFTGPLQRDLPLGQQSSRREDLLVLSPPGQFLNLRIRMGSHPTRNDEGARTQHNGGYATPIVAGLRIHYPRQSYAEYLPAVYAEDQESRSFLERFLSIFQTDWDRIEQQIENIADLFDPTTVPNEAFLDYVAEWLGLTVEGSWDLTQKQRLVTETKKNLGRWGTLECVRRHVGVYLHNISGADPHSWNDVEKKASSKGERKNGKTGEPPSGFPQLLEGFRARRYQVLGDSASLGSAESTLWSRSRVGRLQFDVFAREGEARIVGVGDPALDFFYEHAHRFQVFVPSAWVSTKQAENLIRRAVYESAPAHTCHELCLVEARLRVGAQSTVGVDTIVGAIPTARLAEADQSAVAPSRPPRHRLGYDMVLSRSDRATDIRVGESYAGVGTRLS